jgi:hypothetical protein
MNPEDNLIEKLKEENEKLHEKVKALETEKEDLRRKDAIEDMVFQAQTELANRVKMAGAIITGLLAFVGIASFGALVSSVSQNVNEQASKVALGKILEEVRDTVPQQVREKVSNDLVKEFKQDEKFRELLIDRVTKDPIFQDKIASVAEELTRKRLLEITQEANRTENFAQAVENTYQQATYYVVSGSHTVAADLQRDVLGKALSNGFNAQICSPKKGNQRYALVVSNEPVLALSYENAVKVRDRARKTIQNDAYILPQKGTFFDCRKKAS